MKKVRLAALTMTLAVAGMGLTACSSDRWCEFDATDTKVADRYCEQGVPGYEWEPDSDGKTKTKTKVKSKTKSKSKR
jgi:hypothetical protein